MSNSFNSANVTELPPVWENAGLSSVIMLLVKICLFVFPFDVLGWALGSDLASS